MQYGPVAANHARTTDYYVTIEESVHHLTAKKRLVDTKNTNETF